MKCEQYQEQISPYIDDALSHDEKMEFEAHLKTCPECKETLSIMSHMVGCLSNLEEQELPEGFHQALHERLLKEQAPKQTIKKANRSPFFFMPYVSGIVAAALLAVVILPRVTNRPQEAAWPQQPAASAPSAASLRMETSSDSLEAPAKTRAYSNQVENLEPKTQMINETRGVVQALEEEWMISCEDLTSLEEFIKGYCEEQSIDYTTWEQDQSIHFVLQPNSKEDFKEKLKAQLGNEETIEITETTDEPTIHLIVK